MTHYLIEFSLIIALFGILHFLLLRENKHFSFLRIYITGGLILAAIIPWLPFVWDAANSQTIRSILPTVIIDGSKESQKTFSSTALPPLQMILYVYWLISVFMIVRFTHSIFKISKIIKRAECKQLHNHCLLISDELSDPCSFFNHILLPPMAGVDDNTLNTIIKHEQLHITYKHSPEKIFWEIVFLFLWWHPSIWYLQRQLNLTHEYQVDATIAKSNEIVGYQSTLINLVINPYNLKLVNPITSNIKKRLLMMNSSKNFQAPKYLLLLAILTVGALVIHSCKQDLTEKKAPEQQIENSDASMYAALTDQMTIDTVVTFNPETFEESIVEMKSPTEAKPQFPGCEEVIDLEEKSNCSTQKLLHYVYSQVKYPETARENKEEGKVIAKLAINETGQLDFYEVITAPSQDLSWAVSEMLDKMQAEITWTPGEKSGDAVKAEFILPIQFKLQ